MKLFSQKSFFSMTLACAIAALMMGCGKDNSLEARKDQARKGAGFGEGQSESSSTSIYRHQENAFAYLLISVAPTAPNATVKSVEMRRNGQGTPVGVGGAMTSGRVNENSLRPLTFDLDVKLDNQFRASFLRDHNGELFVYILGPKAESMSGEHEFIVNLDEGGKSRQLTLKRRN